ncbi:hypothetical protein [Methanococcus maripaludis]|uniref:DNA-binding PadR family transcriptional regulator n=1 Tax=Methanococcus maripaludis TaxID=39152 RepID=A0A7J9PCB6_METMI|nr:hypothetical protein [Methanococcus maripaludis]MBA2860883.1 DNA-binding PadR family transcriptional regulator [Methanococcus maripaludis]
MENVQKNVELKRKILRYLYDKFYEEPKPIHKKEIISFIGSKVNLAPLLKSLEIEKYISGHRFTAVTSSSAKTTITYNITSKGIKLIENPLEFDKIFPIQFINNTTNNNLRMVQNNIQYNTTINFQQIYQKLEKEEFDEKDELLKHVKNIENELKKDDKNNASIWNSLMFIKSLEFHASWLFPMISEIVIKYLLFSQF